MQQHNLQINHNINVANHESHHQIHHNAVNSLNADYNNTDYSSVTQTDYNNPNQNQNFNERDASDVSGLGRGTRPPHAPPDHDIERMIEERNEARKAGNFASADDIRDHLKRLGVVLMDEKGARGNRRGLQVTRWRYWNP